MVTVLTDWSMVYLFGKLDGSAPEQRWGRVLVGNVLMDGSNTYPTGSYLCSDHIIRNRGEIAHSRSGQSFSLYGKGRNIELPVTQLEKLRNGESVDSILKALSIADE